MHRRSSNSVGKRPQRPQAQRRRGSSGYRSDQDDTRSSRSRNSSQGSVDSVLIEHFSGSDSISNPSLQGPQSSASDFEPPHPRPNWVTVMARSLNRHFVKRQARKLVVKLISADKEKRDPIEAAKQRFSAAAALVTIINGEQDGGEIVARRFVKSSPRRAEGARALLKLSDDQLRRHGPEAIITDVFCPDDIVYDQLLAVILRHSNKASFFWTTISPLLVDGTEGPAAILYLATVDTRIFFGHIDDYLIFNFCNRVVSGQEPLSPNWYCGVKLLCMLLKSPDRAEWKYRTKLKSLLSTILQSFIHIVTEERQTAAYFVSGYQKFVFRDLPVLPLLAGCCEKIERNLDLEELARSAPLKSFLELLIRFAFPQHTGPRILHTEDGLGVYTLISFLKVRSVANLFLDVELSRFASFLVDMVLRPWALNFEFASAFEQDILKPLTAKDDLYITCLSSLPGSVFSGALSLALKEGMLRINAPNANPYQALSLVERLLSLSNMRVKEGQIHRALVEGGACEFLAHVLHYTGALDSKDRGLWRAKGLAMTCLGNIIERMNKEQLSSWVKEEMITSVVAIKEEEEVPLVQKGQAIFLLQRYTLAADRLGVQHFHREDTSNMAEEFRNRNSGD